MCLFSSKHVWIFWLSALHSASNLNIAVNFASSWLVYENYLKLNDGFYKYSTGSAREKIKQMYHIRNYVTCGYAVKPHLNGI